MRDRAGNQRAPSMTDELKSLRAQLSDMTGERDQAVAKLQEIADESPMPDAFEFYDNWNSPGPYLVRDQKGGIHQPGMKDDDYGDWGAHGYARGVHAMSVKARNALASTSQDSGTPDGCDNGEQS